MGTNVYKPQSSNIGLIVISIIISLVSVAFAGFLYFKMDSDKKSSDEKINVLTSKVEELNSKTASISTNNDDESSNSSSNNYEEIKDNLKNLDVLYVTNVSKKGNKYTLEGVIYSQYTITNSDYEKIIEDGKMEVNDKEFTVKKDSDSENYGLYEEDKDSPSYIIKEKNSRNYYLEANAQIKNVWKLTDEYKKITVDGDVEVENDYSEESSTVKDTFKDFEVKEAEETTNPTPSYTFSFEDGECVKVIEATTSI